MVLQFKSKPLMIVIMLATFIIIPQTVMFFFVFPMLLGVGICGYVGYRLFFSKPKYRIAKL